MKSSQDIATTILNLPVQDYFAQGMDFSEREFKLLQSGFEGVAINAPSSIELSRHDELPVAAATVKTVRRDWQVYQRKNFVLLACNLDTDELYLGQVYPPPEKRPAQEPFSRQPPEPRDQPPLSRSAGIQVLPARARLGLPWKRARFRLAVVHYDWVSNMAQVELKGEGNPEEGMLQTVRPSPAAQAAGGEPSLPCYETIPLSPKLPAEGLEFQVKFEAAALGSLPIYGAFAIKAKRRHIDRAGSVHAGMRKKTLAVVAVVPITMLVFKLDGGVPIRFEWAVPVYGSGPVQEGSPLKGYFAIDVLKGGASLLGLGNQMAYVICDSWIYGPREFQI